jgi:hypothetical protein
VTLQDLLVDIGNAIGMDAFVGPRPRRTSPDGGEDPEVAASALALLGGFPEWIGEMGQLSGPPGRLWYRGGGSQAEVRVLDVRALGFAEA